MNLDNFAIVCKIGEGSFGKVVLARKKDDGALHAVKAVRKEKLLASGSAAMLAVGSNGALNQLAAAMTHGLRNRDCAALERLAQAAPPLRQDDLVFSSLRGRA